MGDTAMQQDTRPVRYETAWFLDWLYGDQPGNIEIVAGRTDPHDPAKIKLVMRTRRWYPNRSDQAVASITQLAEQFGNVYIGVRLYDDRAVATNTRSEAYALPSRVIFVDDAPEEPYLRYSLSVRTSAGSLHGYYKCDGSTTKDDARRAARYLDGDPSGVDMTQLVRVPGTFNTKNGKRFLVEVEDTGPTYQIEELRAKLPKVEPAHNPSGATIEALNWPEVEAHLSNIDALLSCARSQLIKPETQTGRILAGELLTIAGDSSRSMHKYVVMYGFYLRGFADDEITAIGLHLDRQWGVERDKGTAWCKLDCARILAKCHAKMPGVKQSPTRYRKTTEAQPITEVRPVSRARADRPQRFTWAALFTQYQERPELCNLKRKARAGALHISTATLDRLEKELRTHDLIVVETDPQRQGSRVILRGVINIAPVEVLSAAPAADLTDPPSIRAASGQTAIDAPQCIGETRPPPDTPGPAAPQSLADLVREALAYLDAGGARVTFARVRRYVEANAGRPIDLGAMKRVYGAEQQRRQRDRAWGKQLASLPTMKISALTALDKRVQRILADGPGARNYGWAWRLMPHISAEQDRRAEMRDRLRTDRRSRTVDQALLFGEIEAQLAEYRASTKRRTGPIARAAQPAGDGRAAGVFPPPALAPIEPPASVGTLPSLLAGIRRYHAAHAAGGD